MQTELLTIHAKVNSIVKGKFGCSEENLMSTGIIDSIRAVQLALAVEKEFNLPDDTFELKDLQSLTKLSEKIIKCKSA